MSFAWARKAAVALSVGLSGVSAAWAAALPPAEAFYGQVGIVEAALSPSGTKLAITSAKGRTRAGLLVLELGAGGKYRRIFQSEEDDVVDVHWVNDDRLIFRLEDAQLGLGILSEAPGLFAVDADGRHPKQLVRRRGLPVSETITEKQALEWNHRVLAVPRLKAGQRADEVLLAEFAVDDSGVETPLWVDTRSGSTHWADFKAPSKAVEWITDAAGRARVVTTRDEGRVQVYWRKSDDAEWRKISDSGLLDAPFLAHSVDDAGNLYVTEPRGAAGEMVLARYAPATGTVEAKPVVVTPGFDFAGRLVTEPGRDLPLGVRTVVDGETTVWFDKPMKTFQDEADRMFPGRVNSIDCRRCGMADMVALVWSYGDHHPGDLWVYQASPPGDEKKWRHVGQRNEAIDPADMASMELHRIKARDGRDLPVWVTRSDSATQARPAVVLVHGGPWVRGNVWGWHADAQFLASRGYVVIEPEMRGSQGFGDAHFRAGFKQFGQAMQDDVADALRWAQAQGLATDRACIAGASYGGYSTLMGLIKDPSLYRCGVAWLAPADLDLYVSGSWRVTDDIGQTSRRYTLPEMVGDPKKDAGMMAANSPLQMAARIKAPVLLAYGKEDVRVPLAHGERLRSAMQAAGNAPEWIAYPNEGHGFTVPEHQIDFARRVEAFLAKHLGGP